MKLNWCIVICYLMSLLFLYVLFVGDSMHYHSIAAICSRFCSRVDCAFCAQKDYCCPLYAMDKAPKVPTVKVATVAPKTYLFKAIQRRAELSQLHDARMQSLSKNYDMTEDYALKGKFGDTTSLRGQHSTT